jgi:hypothetical protein
MILIILHDNFSSHKGRPPFVRGFPSLLSAFLLHFSTKAAKRLFSARFPVVLVLLFRLILHKQKTTPADRFLSRLPFG